MKGKPSKGGFNGAAVGTAEGQTSGFFAADGRRSLLHGLLIRDVKTDDAKSPLTWERGSDGPSPAWNLELGSRSAHYELWRSTRPMGC